MPKRRVTWACWNYLTRSAIDENSGEKKANVDQVALYVNPLSHTLRHELTPNPAEHVSHYFCNCKTTRSTYDVRLLRLDE